MIEFVAVRQIKIRKAMDTLGGREESRNKVALLGAMISLAALVTTTSVGPYINDLVRYVTHGLGQA